MANQNLRRLALMMMGLTAGMQQGKQARAAQEAQEAADAEARDYRDRQFALQEAQERRLQSDFDARSAAEAEERRYKPFNSIYGSLKPETAKLVQAMLADLPEENVPQEYRGFVGRLKPGAPVKDYQNFTLNVPEQPARVSSEVRDPQSIANLARGGQFDFGTNPGPPEIDLAKMLQGETPSDMLNATHDAARLFGAAAGGKAWEAAGGKADAYPYAGIDKTVPERQMEGVQNRFDRGQAEKVFGRLWGDITAKRIPASDSAAIGGYIWDGWKRAGVIPADTDAPDFAAISKYISPQNAMSNYWRALSYGATMASLGMRGQQFQFEIDKYLANSQDPSASYTPGGGGAKVSVTQQGEVPPMGVGIDDAGLQAIIDNKGAPPNFGKTTGGTGTGTGTGNKTGGLPPKAPPDKSTTGWNNKAITRENADRARKLGFDSVAIDHGGAEVLKNIGYFEREGWLKKGAVTLTGKAKIARAVKAVNDKYNAKYGKGGGAKTGGERFKTSGKGSPPAFIANWKKKHPKGTFNQLLEAIGASGNGGWNLDAVKAEWAR